MELQKKKTIGKIKPVDNCKSSTLGECKFLPMLLEIAGIDRRQHILMSSLFYILLVVVKPLQDVTLFEKSRTDVAYYLFELTGEEVTQILP